MVKIDNFIKNHTARAYLTLVVLDLAVDGLDMFVMISELVYSDEERKAFNSVLVEPAL